MKTLITDGETYWQQHSQFYPYQLKLKTGASPDPVSVERECTFEGQFIKVFFDGLHHWGFSSQADRELFMVTYGF